VKQLKNAISLSLRKLDWNGYGYYEKYKTRKYYLYLIILTFRDKSSKSGLKFFFIKKRYTKSNYEVIKSGRTSRTNIQIKFFLITFQNYMCFGPPNFAGRTECSDE
jgi:hypothetical protein